MKKQTLSEVNELWFEKFDAGVRQYLVLELGADTAETKSLAV